MNKCRRNRENLLAFLSGELSETEKEKVSRHLETCPRCGREISEIRETLRIADSLNPKLEKVQAVVDWEAQADKIVAAAWKEEGLPRPAPNRERSWLLAPRLRPVLAGLLAGIMIGGLAMFMIFRESTSPKRGGEKLFASGEFLDRVDVEIARRETLDYLDKSQYVLFELTQASSDSGTFRLSEAAARETRELLSKKKLLNPQLEKVRMAKAKAICDQIELLFYELAQVSVDLSQAQRQEIQGMIEEKNLLLKIKLLRKELQKSEV
jgi:hypothetical protein